MTTMLKELKQQTTAAIELLNSLGYVDGDIVDGLRNVESNLSVTVACFQYGEDELTSVADELDSTLSDVEIADLAERLAAGNFIQTEAYPHVRKAIEQAVNHYRVWKASNIEF